MRGPKGVVFFVFFNVIDFLYLLFPYEIPSCTYQTYSTFFPLPMYIRLAMHAFENLLFMF